MKNIFPKKTIYTISLFLTCFYVSASAQATSTNCGNNSNTTEPGRNVVACGLFNNAGTATGGENAVFGISNSTVNGQSSVAIGSYNVVGIDSGVPFVGADYSVAVGSDNKVQGNLSNVVGHQNTAFGANMNIMGSNNQVGVSGNNTISRGSLVIGNQNSLTNTYISGGKTGSFVIGNENSVDGDLNVAIGIGNVADGLSGARNSFVAGVKSKVYGFQSIAIGNLAHAGTIDNYADSAVAIGSQAFAEGQYATALGSGASAMADYATAMGTGSSALAEGSMAFGLDAVADTANSVALGSNALASAIHTGAYGINGGTPAAIPVAANGVVSFGRAGFERQVQHVASGVVSATSTDAVNGSQLYAVGANVEALGASTAAALGGGSAYTTGGGVSAPSYQVQSRSYNNVGAAIASVDSRLTALNNSVGALNDNVGALREGVKRSFEGAAVAIAHTSPTISPDAKFGIAWKWGNFRGENALGAMAQARVNDRMIFNASMGVGFKYGGVGVGVGGLFEW